LQTFDERGGATCAARHHENRVVAGNRADDLGQPRTVERERDRLRLTGAGADDDELLDAVDAAQELGGGGAEGGNRGPGMGGGGAGTLVGAITGALDEAELLDVARNGRLGRLEAALMEAAAQLLLAVERLAIDELEERGLSARFHATNE